jgi:hypothetical protein
MRRTFLIRAAEKVTVRPSEFRKLRLAVNRGAWNTAPLMPWFGDKKLITQFASPHMPIVLRVEIEAKERLRDRAP